MARWIKIARGHYRLEGTPFEVQSDGYEKSQSISAEVSTGYEGFTGGEWAVIDTRGGGDGENLDWFDTMREARAAAERWARVV
jgi:hypothetical protein